MYVPGHFYRCFIKKMHTDVPGVTQEPTKTPGAETPWKLGGNDLHSGLTMLQCQCFPQAKLLCYQAIETARYWAMGLINSMNSLGNGLGVLQAFSIAPTLLSLVAPQEGRQTSIYLSIYLSIFKFPLELESLETLGRPGA